MLDMLVWHSLRIRASSNALRVLFYICNCILLSYISILSCILSCCPASMSLARVQISAVNARMYKTAVESSTGQIEEADLVKCELVANKEVSFHLHYEVLSTCSRQIESICVNLSKMTCQRLAESQKCLCCLQSCSISCTLSRRTERLPIQQCMPTVLPSCREQPFLQQLLLTVTMSPQTMGLSGF